MSIRPVFSWYTCLLLHATVTVHMCCVGRGVTLCCSIVKVKHGINAVQSKLQGRHNITAQQLLSFFRVLLYYRKLLILIVAKRYVPFVYVTLLLLKIYYYLIFNCLS